MHRSCAIAVCLFWAGLTAAAELPPQLRATADELMARALQGNEAYATVESLTTEVGPRQAGSPAEARARQWAVDRLEALGFSNADHAGGAGVPAAALSAPDADQLARALSRGKPVVVKLVLTPTTEAVAESGNVIAELPGREVPGEIVLAGAHLDSWDLGTGAVDDAAGVGIVTGAAPTSPFCARPGCR